MILKSLIVGFVAAIAVGFALAVSFYSGFVAKIPAGTQIGFTVPFLLQRFLLPTFATFLVGFGLAYLYMRSKQGT